MSIPPDLLQAFIDGRLAAEDASGVAAEIANDPDLAAYVADQKALNAALASPAAIWLRKAQQRAASLSGSAIPALAMAAGIVLGVLLAASFGIATDMRSEGGTLIAQGELAHILSTALPAEENPRRGAARVGPSFWSKNGSFCRSFATRGNGESALAGLACRERGAWRIAAIAAIEPAGSAGSKLAASDLPASVRGVMDNLIVGEPLDSDAERQARYQGWRTR
jgi:predicted outer membrane lipoprotein